MAKVRAVAVDREYTYLGYGVVTTTHPDTLTSLDRLVTRAASRFHVEGVLVITGAVAELLGLPEREPRDGTDHPALAGLRSAGWEVSRLSAWTTFHGDDRPRVFLCVLPWIDADRKATDRFRPIYEPGLDLGTLAWRLGRFHELFGASFRATPGVSALGLLRDHCQPKGRPLRGYQWVPDTADWPPAYLVAGRPPVWRRDPDEHERARPNVYAYDANMMYLAAAGNAELAADPLTRSGPCLFDRKLAGYWLVEPLAWNDPRMPDPCSPLRGRGEQWLPTPIMQLLVELGRCPQVIDSWTAPGRRLLQPWYERVRDGLADAAEEPDDVDTCAVRAAMKMAYTQGLGLLDKNNGNTARVYRPDWYHTVEALAWANLCRKILKAGREENRWPLKIDTDCLWYAAEAQEPDLAAPVAFRIGTGPGTFKVMAKGCSSLPDYMGWMAA